MRKEMRRMKMKYEAFISNVVFRFSFLFSFFSSSFCICLRETYKMFQFVKLFVNSYVRVTWMENFRCSFMRNNIISSSIYAAVDLYVALCMCVYFFSLFFCSSSCCFQMNERILWSIAFVFLQKLRQKRNEMRKNEKQIVTIFVEVISHEWIIWVQAHFLWPRAEMQRNKKLLSRQTICPHTHRENRKKKLRKMNIYFLFSHFFLNILCTIFSFDHLFDGSFTLRVDYRDHF